MDLRHLVAATVVAVTAAVSGGPARAAAAASLCGLIVLSHGTGGTGGTELGHGRLAEALAARGYPVAALRHPRDNWQDDSLRTQRAER